MAPGLLQLAPVDLTLRAWLLAALSGLFASSVAAQRTAEPRARDVGIPFDGTPGPNNAITDVAGVLVGYTTLNRGSGPRAVRTGVTAILPRNRATANRPVFAGVFRLNGNGEMTGTHWIEESGFLEGPVLFTNTHSVGVVRDAVIAWRVKQGKADASGYYWSLPVVAETWDGELNDINGFHVQPSHVFAALESAHGGRLEEGNVGGGTGMTCHGFKCGTGTSSRVVAIDRESFTLGVIVQANYGVREELRIAGVPVGRELSKAAAPTAPRKDQGSILIVVATDAPLLPTQLERIARRAALGLARNGSYAGNGSGDLFLAFSTANENVGLVGPATLRALGNDQLDPLFLATVQAVEESIVNALIAAETMTGLNGARAEAIEPALVREILARYGRLAR
ncbi:MAG TPA: P1 family peptidase [Polyangiales bacterium]|nr:P1 family peptidase [Polyangiales bacterium]